MTEINYSMLLREIIVDYFDQRISRVEYLAERRSILDRVDHEFNGAKDTSGWPEPDVTQPADCCISQINTLLPNDDDITGKLFE
jgi:hypothetical protein